MSTRRSRTVAGSCWPCKRRRVRCDLARPSCERCAAAHQACEYSRTRLKWVNGMAARGKLAGRGFPDAAPAVERPLTQPMTVTNFLLYFSRAVVPRFSLGIDSLDIDLAAVNCDPVLQHSVVALSNAHYALGSRVDSPQAALAKGRARLAALAVFRRQLAVASANSPDALFVANVFLCVLDGIVEPADEAAAMVCHFRGGRALLSSPGCLDRLRLSTHRLSSFAVSIFATMDLVHSLLTGQQPFFDQSWVAERAGCPSWWGCLAAADPFLGILSTLFRLAALGHRCRHDVGASIPIEEVLAIRSALEELGATPPASPADPASTPDPMADPDADPAGKGFRASWAAFCCAYRSTALIYMYRVLCNLDPDDPLVQGATRSGVDAVCTKKLTGNIPHCMLFPVLVIGSHCTSADDRKMLLQMLQANASYLAFGSIQLMEQFLRDRWDNPDSAQPFDWWECFGDIAYRTAVF